MHWCQLGHSEIVANDQYIMYIYYMAQYYVQNVRIHMQMLSFSLI